MLLAQCCLRCGCPRRCGGALAEDAREVEIFERDVAAIVQRWVQAARDDVLLLAVWRSSGTGHGGRSFEHGGRQQQQAKRRGHHPLQICRFFLAKTAENLL